MQKVSVVTMTYNDCLHLKDCLKSILKQDYSNMECIVVDGGSTDGTVAFLEEMKEAYPTRLRFVSEPDGGLYDALNKGIKMATGDIIGLMCDSFADEHVIADMVDQIEKSGADGVHGDLDFVRGNQIVRKWRMGQGDIKWGWMPAHPTMYLKKEIYDSYGLYKTDYKIAADYEFMLRILKDDQVKLAYIPRVLVKMYYGETSASTGGLRSYINSFMEGVRAMKENQMKHPYLTSIVRTFRVLKQF